MPSLQNKTCPVENPLNVFKAHRLLYHSTLGLRVMKKKKKNPLKRCGSLVGIDRLLRWTVQMTSLVIVNPESLIFVY